MTSLGTALALVTATASGLTAGVFLGFSALVMPALRGRPPAEAVAAMQAVNLVAPRSLLMVPLLLSAAGCLLVGVHALVTRPAGQGLLLSGAAAGLAAFAVTAGYHVPRNDALALLDPAAPGTAAAWARYAAGWTVLNSVRTVLGLVSAVALVGGVLARGPQG
ncbi:anthrone oxygenase family protein [Microlunatus capsulatus]|uniref:Membrane protein n=1 Tax=Microlunatus capsulatus TaxID=99117 RepID=A0ABS4ZB51_9ACTN|nr:anthrone oxygenase family protein [Microlunatus capsulatus]MBP2418276.1 putative membrane protein [Microlunatus capsulatus]